MSNSDDDDDDENDSENNDEGEDDDEGDDKDDDDKDDDDKGDDDDDDEGEEKEDDEDEGEEKEDEEGEDEEGEEEEDDESSGDGKKKKKKKRKIVLKISQPEKRMREKPNVNKWIHNLNPVNKRFETLMNKDIVETESEEIDKEYLQNFNKKDIIQSQINEKRVDEINEEHEYEVGLLLDHIRHIEEQNIKLDDINQIYYDIIQDGSLDCKKADLNCDINFQSLGYNPNYPSPIPPIDNNELLAQCVIDNERNKYIHAFNDSMVNINKKITNYLIDRCIDQTDNSAKLEKIQKQIDEKLEKMERLQKEQKHDLDFIIKYGLNKNRALDPIVGILLDPPKSIPKTKFDKDEKITNELNLTPLKNFSVYGRYSKKINDAKKKNNILRRSGSSIFENKLQREYNYKFDDDVDPHKFDHNIYPNYSKRPIFEKVDVDSRKNYEEIIKHKKIEYPEEDIGIKKERLNAYKNKFFLPLEFRFGGGMSKTNQRNEKDMRVNSISSFII